MVYVDPKNLGYKPYWQKWVSGRSSKQEREDLNRLYEKYVPALIDMVVEGIQDGKQGEKLKTIVPLTNLNMVGVGGVGCVCVCMCVCMFVIPRHCSACSASKLTSLHVWGQLTSQSLLIPSFAAQALANNKC